MVELDEKRRGVALLPSETSICPTLCDGPSPGDPSFGGLPLSGVPIYRVGNVEINLAYVRRTAIARRPTDGRPVVSVWLADGSQSTFTFESPLAEQFIELMDSLRANLSEPIHAASPQKYELHGATQKDAA